jgi:hypothetical protein
MGFGKAMLIDFETTIKSTDSDAVITPKPITLNRNIPVVEPGTPAFLDLQDICGPDRERTAWMVSSGIESARLSV